MRDLVRAREAAKKDQLRARHRLAKFLLRQGRSTPEAMTSWTNRHLKWVREQRFEHAAHEATLSDYLHEVEHVGNRIERLEQAIDSAIKSVPEKMRAVIEALQALRGVAQISAVSIVTEIGELSRFARPKQLMAYTGVVASEHSSGERIRRYGITKAGNAHLRRIVIEAAWSYQHRPLCTGALKKRQERVCEEVREIAWKVQHRLHDRYRRLIARGKSKQQTATAVARELLGFVWAIGAQVERGVA